MGQLERRADLALFRLWQFDARASLLSPGAGEWLKRLAVLFDQRLLLLECDSHHGPFLAVRGERGEDLPAQAKVGVSHVLALGRLRKGKGQAAESVFRHGERTLCVHSWPAFLHVTTAG